LKSGVVKVITVFFFSWITFSTHSQEVKTVRDIGFWTSAGIQYRFNEKWSSTASQEVRFFDNASRLNRLISDLGVRYSINNQFKLGFNLRYAYAIKKEGVYTNDIRYNLDFMYKLKLSKHLDLKYRFRFQNNFINRSSYYEEFTRKSHARNQVELDYEVKKHTYYFTAELFREYVIYRRPHFDNLRMSIGDQIKGKLGVFDYSICYELELNDSHPLNFFFLRFDYTFKFKHKDE
jgi:hypothetical protein